MKELHFTRTGRMHVATEGNLRFTIHEHKVNGSWHMRWRASIFERQSPRVSPLHSSEHASKAEAIDWLARYRVQHEGRAS